MLATGSLHVFLNKHACNMSVACFSKQTCLQHERCVFFPKTHACNKGVTCFSKQTCLQHERCVFFGYRVAAPTLGTELRRPLWVQSSGALFGYRGAAPTLGTEKFARKIAQTICARIWRGNSSQKFNAKFGRHIFAKMLREICFIKFFQVEACVCTCKCTCECTCNCTW